MTDWLVWIGQVFFICALAALIPAVIVGVALIYIELFHALAEKYNSWRDRV